MTADDARHMAHALSLAARGQGRVWPNPSVGCVVVKDGRVVGRARTADGGRPHAETQALDMAGNAARGATVYVTLEPCSHHGQTPPCADALIAAGIARVVVAMRDPDPKVDGAGLKRLEAAGIHCDIGTLGDVARDSLLGFTLSVTKTRPRLTLKLASTLDGRIATATGESRWITGPEARRAVHAMRARHDGVLIGAGTMRSDNPTLTVRDMGADRQPVRIVASRQLNLPWPNRLADTVSEGPVWLLHGEGEVQNADKWRDAGADLIAVESTDGRLNPLEMLKKLGRAGLTSVFCEGGGSLASSLLHAGLVDDLIVFSAGAALGAEGKPSVGTLGIAALADAPRFDLVEVRRVGNDVMQKWARPSP